MRMWNLVALAGVFGCGAATATAADERGRCEDAGVEAPTAVGTRIAGPLSDAWLSGARDAEERVAVVVFWEVWCPHCRTEMPRLRDVDTLDGIEVVGLTRLTRGATEAQVAQFVAEQGIDYAVGRDTRGLAERLGVRGVPSAVVLRDGEVVWQGHPAKLTDAELQGWL
jgi:thiol-disulfide isomerase/thioredoxin